MERGTVERWLAGRKGASRVALNGLSPLEQPDASRTDVSSGVIQFMKPWTHACTMRMYVCAPSILPVYGANGQETARPECSWNWIKSILYSRNAAP